MNRLMLIGLAPLVFCFFLPEILKLSFFTRAIRMSMSPQNGGFQRSTGAGPRPASGPNPARSAVRPPARPALPSPSPVPTITSCPMTECVIRCRITDVSGCAVRSILSNSTARGKAPGANTDTDEGPA